MQEQLRTGLVWIDVEVIDPRGVECRGSSNQSVDFVSLAQQEFGKIRAVLTGDPKNECSLHWLPIPVGHHTSSNFAATRPAAHQRAGRVAS
jgi:hypothetical protein